MGEAQGVGSVFIAANSYRRAAGNGLEVLPRVDEAIGDFVSTFYSLRFYVKACCDCTTDEFRSLLREFLEAFKRGGRTSGKYAVFVFVGHGGEGDVLYTEDGKTISTEEVVKSFTAELPKTVLKMFFIDACRKDGDVSVALPYCPAEEICLLARSTLPYQKAWTQGSYGVWSHALSKQLLTSASVQSALMAVCNTLKLEFNLPERQFPQYISNGFPEVAWMADVEYEGGFLGSPPAEKLQELAKLKSELEQYRGGALQQCPTTAAHLSSGSVAKALGGQHSCEKQTQNICRVLRLPEISKDILHHKPTLEVLVQIAITQVAYKWEELAIFLDVSTAITAVIKASDRVTSEGHCKEMLIQWLNTTGMEPGSKMGRKPRTWSSILQAVGDSIGFVVADEVKTNLFPNPSPEDNGRKPNIKLLLRHVIPEVTAQWQKFGLFLDIDQAKLDALVKPANQHGVRVWCEEMFKLWLKGEPNTGSEPRTWESVLGAVTDAIGGGVSQEIERRLRDPDVDIN